MLSDRMRAVTQRNCADGPCLPLESGVIRAVRSIASWTRQFFAPGRWSFPRTPFPGSSTGRRRTSAVPRPCNSDAAATNTSGPSSADSEALTLAAADRFAVGPFRGYRLRMSGQERQTTGHAVRGQWRRSLIPIDSSNSDASGWTLANGCVCETIFAFNRAP
jgi:hypothetical protein